MGRVGGRNARHGGSGIGRDLVCFDGSRWRDGEGKGGLEVEDTRHGGRNAQEGKGTKFQGGGDGKVTN